MAICGAITAAVFPVLGLGWTITTVDEGIGVRLSFYHGTKEFFFIVDGQIHMEYYNRAMNEELTLKVEVAVKNFVWRE